jgi:hypothetical protein
VAQGVLSDTHTRDGGEFRVEARSPIGEAASQRTHKMQLCAKLHTLPEGNRTSASPGGASQKSHWHTHRDIFFMFEVQQQADLGSQGPRRYKHLLENGS